jgi:hypothetical protein
MWAGDALNTTCSYLHKTLKPKLILFPETVPAQSSHLIGRHSQLHLVSGGKYSHPFSPKELHRLLFQYFFSESSKSRPG